MASAAIFSASGRRLLSTAATAGNTELPVSIAHLRSLARAGRLADVDAALLPLLPSHCVAVISAFSAVGLPDRASSILKTIRSPTAEHLNALLRPLVGRDRLARLVPSLLAAHPSVPRDAATDCIHAKALCRSSGPESAMPLLQRESPRTLQLFTTIINSYYKNGQPHRAEELWRAMVEDHGIVPDATAYNTRIIYKSSNGTVEEVKELIRAMREDAGLIPDIFSYNALMRAMARQRKKVDELLEVYRSLHLEEGKEEGDQPENGEGEGSAAAPAAAGRPVPNAGTYACVVAALCKAGRWSEADDVFYEAMKWRKVPDLDTARALVSGLKKAGKGRAARRVVAGLRKKFPMHFDGPWKELEELAGVRADGRHRLGGGREGNDDDEQPTATAA